MTQLQKYLPVLGVVAFSLCSTYSIFQLLSGKALHPSPLFWLPAVLVELVTAWAVYQCVTQFRRVVQSNISKQDRRFHLGILAAFLALTAPTLAASVWANTIEFSGLLLGLLFPMASVCCAISAALPGVAARYEQARASKSKQSSSKSKQSSSERQADARRRQEVDKLLSSLSQARRQVYDKLAQDPDKSLSSIGKELSISRQAASQHVAGLEQVGLVRRNGNGLEVTQ